MLSRCGSRFKGTTATKKNLKIFVVCIDTTHTICNNGGVLGEWLIDDDGNLKLLTTPKGRNEEKMKTLKSVNHEVHVRRSADYFVAYVEGDRVRSGKPGALPDVLTKAEMSEELAKQFDATIARQFNKWA